MKLPKRKVNRLRKYNYSNGGSYFITICVQDTILSEIVDCGDNRPEIHLTVIGEIIEKNIQSINRVQGITVENYVIMPDHIHMILYVENPAGEIEKSECPSNERIPQVISAFKRISQKEIGKKIYQRGYYDHIIRDENDYNTKYQYIEDNPANWLLKKRSW